MRRLLATLALVALLPGALWAASISQSPTDTSTLVAITIDSSLQVGEWSKVTKACSSFRAIWEPAGAANAAEIKLHAVQNPGQAISDSTTLINTFTTAVAEPGLGLNATAQYFAVEITKAQGDANTSRLTLRCSNAQAI